MDNYKFEINIIKSPKKAKTTDYFQELARDVLDHVDLTTAITMSTTPGNRWITVNFRD